MKKIKYIVSILAIISLVGPFSFGDIFGSVKAVSAGPAVSVSASSSSLGATASYTFTLTNSSELSVSSGRLRIEFNAYYRGNQTPGAVIDFSGASLGYIKDDGVALAGASLEVPAEWPNNATIWVNAPATISAGSTIKVYLTGVSNPSVAGTYGVHFMTGEDAAGWTQVDEGQNDSALILGINKFIEGYVTYSTGGGVSTCQVNANKQGVQEWANAECGPDGHYRLGVTSTGTWQLHLDAKWENNQPVTTDWIYEGMDAYVDVTGAGTFTKNFKVTKATALVKGKIVLPDGTVPTEPWKFHVDLRDEQGRGSGASLNNSGVFSIPMKAGTYKLSLWSENPKYYINASKITVAENETKNLGTIKLSEKTAKIRGKVTNESGTPIKGLRMNMWGPNGWGEATTATDGTYTIWTYVGDWEIMVDQWEAAQKGLIMQGPPTRVSITSSTQTITGVNFKLIQANANIKMNLIDKNGQKIENIHGYAYCRKANAMPGPNSDFGTGIGGPNMTPLIPLLGGYTYKCGAHVPSEFGISLEKEVEVSVAVGQTKTINVVFVRNDAEIVGYLRDASTGAVITGIDGEVFAHGESMGMGYNARINADGSYRLSLRNGVYFVGYNTWTPGFMQGEPDRAPVVVPPNGRVVKTIKVHRANAYIKATVLDPDGNKVPWAWVWCDNMKQKEEEMKGPFEGGEVLHAGGDTGNGGLAKIGVVAGEYTCGAGLPPEMSEFMPPDMVDVLAKANTETPITLRFKESEGNMKGSVETENGSQVNMGFCHAWNPEGGFSGSQVFNGSYNIPLTRGTWYVGCDSMDGKKFYRSDETPITLSTVGETINKDFVLRQSAFELPEGISVTFDASQMTVVNLPDESVITIPANAVNTEGNYTLTASPNINLYFTPEAKPALGFAWSLELTDSSGQPFTSNFNSNVTISVKYDGEHLAAEGIDENKIIGRYWDEASSTWKLPDNVTVDTVNDTVMIMVNHFTDFAVTTGSNQYGGRTPKNIVTGAKAGAGPHVTVWNSVGELQASFMAYSTEFHGGVKAVEADVDGNGSKEIITIPYSNGGPHVRVFSSSGEPMADVFPYVMAFYGGLSLAAGDVDGDGADEIIVAPTSGGGPHVRVYKYNNGALEHYSSFFAYPEGLRTGMNVYAGDVDGDGDDDIVTSTRAGATPHVRALDGQGNLLGQFFAFPEAYKGGVNVSLRDWNGDGAKDILVTPTSNGGPQFRVLTHDGTLLEQDFAYSSTYRIGIQASMGEVDGITSKKEIIVAPSNGGPHMWLWREDSHSNPGNQWFAYDTAFRGGLELEVADLDADGTDEIVVVPMSQGGPHVKIFDASGNLKTHFMSHHPAFRGGVNLSVSQ